MIRLFILLILSSLAAWPALAQSPALYQGANLTLTEGATLYVQGDLLNVSGSTFDNQGKIVVTGNLVQESDAALFTTSGSVEMNGTTRQVIGGSGTGAVNLDSLIINNSDTVELARDGVSVASGVQFAQGILYLNENRALALGSTGELVNEQESSRAAGPGSLTASADLNAPSSVDPGNLGLLISSSQNLGSTTVTRIHTPTGPEDNSITRSYAVNPTNNQNLDASLQLNYFDAELNGLTEATLAPFTSDDGSTWLQQTATVQSTDENYVQYGNLSSLNLTTLSEGQPLPVADAGTDQEVCAGESVQLGGSPTASEGTAPFIYSWTPIEGLDDASLANPTATPTSTTTYTVLVTDANGLTAESSVEITINPLPVVTFTTVAPQCIDAEAIDLSNLVTPTGGSFSGTGITDSSFDPATAGVGIHTITYFYSDANGCENSATVDIVVNDLPVVTFDPVAMLFVGDDPIDLSGKVSPFGGIFSGAGISGNSFDPTEAGEGIHPITYAYVGGNGCENTASIDIEVAAIQLSVSHKNADLQSYNNTIRPYLKFDNQGDYPVPYEKITLRYWLTVEDFSPMTNLSVYWAQLGTRKVHMTYVELPEPRQGALGYIEYSFDASAGELGAGRNSGPIYNGIAKQNWTGFNETDDHSYASTFIYTPNEQITAYYNGELVWGTEPTIVAEAQNIKVYSQTRRPANSNTIGTFVQVRNEGNVPVSYQDLTVRYWFTADGEAAVNFYLDYAVLGNANVSGQVVRLDEPLPGADRYLELSFTSGLGNLYPLSSTGNIQYRMAKSNWSRFDQSDDHSYIPPGLMSENINMTVYLDGELIYGTEPVGANARVLSETAGKTSDATLAFSEESTLAGELQWKVYPNPVVEEVFIEVESVVAEEATVQVYDLMGRLLMEQQASLNPGGNQLHLTEVGRWVSNANQMVLYLQSPSLGVKQVKLLRP